MLVFFFFLMLWVFCLFGWGFFGGVLCCLVAFFFVLFENDILT